MATSGQGLSFGDFEDLSPEEIQRISHILHGQKNYPTKVEFPWDGESERLTDEEGGSNYFLEKPGILAEPGSQSNEYVYQEAEFTFGTVQVSEYSCGSATRRFISFDDSNDIQHIDKQSQDDEAMQADRNAQSKLQASLKQYERRNKKKRPRDYYKEPTEDSQSSMNYVEGYRNAGEPVQQEMMSQHGHFQMYTTTTNIQNHGMNYSETSDVNNRNVMLPGDTQYVVSYGPGNATYNTHPNQATYTEPAPPYTHVNMSSNNFTNQGQRDHQEGVVDSNNMAYTMPASTETYQIQDHVRTSSVQNIQFGGPVYDYNDSSVIQISVKSDPNSVNQINATNEGQMYNINNSELQSVTVPVSSSQQQQQPQPNLHSNAGVRSVNPDIPDSNIPGGLSQSDPQTVRIESTAVGGEPGNVNDMMYAEVRNSASTQVIPESMDTDGSASKSVNNSVQSDSKPKLSWAGLFKGNSAGSNTSPVIYSDKSNYSPNQPDNYNQVKKKPEKELSPIPVPAKDDSIAKELGEMLSQMTISHASIALQPRGLVNRGNWCYINGTLQALVACPPFYNLLKKMPKYPALSRGPSSTPILDSLVEFVHEFHPMSRQPLERGQRNRGQRELSPGPPFEPSYVYKMLQAIAVNPHFKLGKQEDAEEFLSCILDGAHEEMAAAVNLITKETSQSESPEEEGAYTNGYYHADEEEEMQDDENWEQVGPKKKSVLTRRSSFAKTPVADIFAGMIRSGVYKASAKETATLEPFFTLQLDIQSEKVCSVRDALDILMSKEVISGYTDTKTNTEVEVVKKLSLEELPPVLILHLKFFVYNKDGGSQKLMKKVDYPVELEITKDLLSPNARNKLNSHQRTYKLFAVVYHHGKNMTGGHYTTCVFHPGINGWVLSDDSTVKTVHVGAVLKYIPPRVPYLLYYRRLDSH